MSPPPPRLHIPGQKHAPASAPKKGGGGVDVCSQRKHAGCSMKHLLHFPPSQNEPKFILEDSREQHGRESLFFFLQTWLFFIFLSAIF